MTSLIRVDARSKYNFLWSFRSRNFEKLRARNKSKYKTERNNRPLLALHCLFHGVLVDSLPPTGGRDDKNRVPANAHQTWPLPCKYPLTYFEPAYAPCRRNLCMHIGRFLLQRASAVSAIQHIYPHGVATGGNTTHHRPAADVRPARFSAIVLFYRSAVCTSKEEHVLARETIRSNKRQKYKGAISHRRAKCLKMRKRDRKQKIHRLSFLIRFVCCNAAQFQPIAHLSDAILLFSFKSFCTFSQISLNHFFSLFVSNAEFQEILATTTGG